MKKKRTHSQRIKEGIAKKKLESVRLQPPVSANMLIQGTQDECAKPPVPTQQSNYDARRDGIRRGRAEGLSIALQAIAREITDLC